MSRVLDTLQDNTLRVVQSDDHSQINKPPGHRDIGDVHGSDLIGPDYGHMAQQVGIDPVARVLLVLQIVHARRKGSVNVPWNNHGAP